MLRNHLVLAVSLALAGVTCAQQSSQPQVKVNVLNVCSPSAEEKQQLTSALALVPQKASFTQDFEIDRGRSLLDQGADFLQTGQNAQVAPDSGTADWVRMRREFAGHTPFSRVQYSFSRDPKNMVETLVLVVRDPKDLLQIVIEDSSPAAASPSDMLGSNAAASRIRLERFGKSSIVLARCFGTENKPAPDQSAYEPLFQSASQISAKYRDLLGVQHTVPLELARLAQPAASAPKNIGKKPVSSDQHH